MSNAIISGPAIRDASVPVAAEWALWGKTASDRGYHLLNCSEGSLGPDDFTEVLTRYSPGTLDRLPQVTISWSPRDDRSLLGIAIHDQAEQGLCDAEGREIVFTRYFCVPYQDLAAGAIPYLAMYEEFSKFTLTGQERELIKAELDTTPPTAPRDGLALRVAALLLTGKPVCIVGADGVEFRERLRFLDCVASMLPYGMRSFLSASTWASSTSQKHKFRLFFASAPRRARDDHVVAWGRPDHAPIGNGYADEYLGWLQSEIARPTARLAGHTQQMDFSPKAVLQMLETVGASSDGPPAYSNAADPTVPFQWSAPRPTDGMTAEQLIIACGQEYGRPDPGPIGPYIEPLRACASQEWSPEERSYHQRLIKKYRLLTENKRIDGLVKTRLYDALLPLAFDGRLTYGDYCDLEAWAEVPAGASPNRSLLDSLAKAEFDNFATFLLVVASADGRGLSRRLPKNTEFSWLIGEIATAKVTRHHARVLCDAAVRLLGEGAGPAHPQELRSVLRTYGYLATLLDGCYPDDIEQQRKALSALVQAAHGHKLDMSSIASILGHSGLAPTAALLAVVLEMVSPEDTGCVFLEFSRGLLGNAAFTDETRWRLDGLLPGGLGGSDPVVPGAGTTDTETAHALRRGIERIKSHLPSRN
jgi:hypothetical protein